MTDFEEFERKQKKPLDFSDAFNDAFEIYKKIALPAGSALLVITTLLLLCIIVIGGSFINMEQLAENMKTFKPEALSLQANLIYIGVITLINILVSPFIAGILKMAHDADHDQEVKFSSIGVYVNSNKFLPIILNITVLTIANIGVDSFLSRLIPDYGNLVALCITFPLGILTFISLPLILFNDMNFVQAITSSIRLVSSNFFLVLALFVLANILALVGIIAFCLGIIFTLPFIYAMQYVIYKSLAD